MKVDHTLVSEGFSHDLARFLQVALPTETLLHSLELQGAGSATVSTANPPLLFKVI